MHGIENYFAVSRPVTLAGLLDLLQKHPGTRLVGGSNELSIAHKYGAPVPKTLIAISHIPELTQLEVGALQVCTFGSASKLGSLQPGSLKVSDP